MRAAALIPLFVSLVGVLPFQSREGFLDRPVSEVARSSFFTSFKLEEVRRRFSFELAQFVFQPPAPARDFVRVNIRTNGEGETRIVDVSISRVFIEGASSAEARRFVRGLLQEGVPAGDEPSIPVFVTELGGAPPKQPSAAYQVFAGSRQQYAVTGKQARVTLRNAGDGASRAFRIELRRAAGSPD